MDVQELFENYRNREVLMYSVESAKTQILMSVFNLKNCMNLKQLNAFNKLELAIKEWEEVVLADMFDFVVKFCNKKNTSD